MTKRLDQASHVIAASPEKIFRAFTQADALVSWLPPTGMTGEMLHFDFRAGGRYRMRLHYPITHSGHGKTAEGYDDVDVNLVAIEPYACIEQAIVFDSAEPAFSGTMKMVWRFAAEGNGTKVSICAEDVPAGIDQGDHQTAMTASLLNLAQYLKKQSE